MKQLLRTSLFCLFLVSLTIPLGVSASDELTQAMGVESKISPQSLAIKLEKFWHDQIWNRKKIARNVTLSLIALHLIALSRGTSVASKKAYPPTNWLARGADAGVGRLLRALTNRWAKREYDAAFKATTFLDPGTMALRAVDKKARHIPADPFGWNQLRASDASIPFLRRKEASDIANSAQQRAQECSPRWRWVHTIEEKKTLKKHLTTLLKLVREKTASIAETVKAEAPFVADVAKTQAPRVIASAKRQLTLPRLRAINTALALLLLKMVSPQIGLGALV